MNKAATIKLSLRKLFIAILAIGPLAILPGPLWALPVAGMYQVTNGAATLTVAGTTANFSVSNGTVIVWSGNDIGVTGNYGFGNGTATGTGNNTFNILAGETWNFSGLSATGAVLNKVGYNTNGTAMANPATALINGTLSSSGKVFILANGNIVVNSGASINTAGGLVLSTLNETSDFNFTTQGNLSFSGTSNGSVFIGNSWVPATVTNNTFSNYTVGGGANGVLTTSTTAAGVTGGSLAAYAGAVVVNNVTVAGDFLVNQTTLGTAFAPTTAIIGSGNVTVVTNNGSIGDATGVWTVANGTTSLTTLGGNVINMAAANNFKTISVTTNGTAGDATINDINSVVLGTSSTGRDLIVTAVGNTTTGAGISTSGTLTIGRKGVFTTSNTTGNTAINIANNSTIGSTGTFNAATASDSPITFNGLGNVSVGTVNTNTGAITANLASVSITTNGVLAVNAPMLVTGNGVGGDSAGGISLTGSSIVINNTVSTVSYAGSISLNATSGNITTNNAITSSNALTLNASAGSINSGGQPAFAITTGVTKTSGNITIKTASTGSADLSNTTNAFAATQNVAFTGGSLTLNNTLGLKVGTTNATGDVNLVSTGAGVVLGNGTGTSAQNLLVGGGLTIAAATGITDNNYSTINVTGGANLTTAAGGIVLDAAYANGALSPSVKFGSVTANANASAVTIGQTNDLVLGTINGTVITANSVSGNISQSDKITAATSANFTVANAAGTITLGNTSNVFGTLGLGLFGGSNASATAKGGGTTILTIGSGAPANTTVTSNNSGIVSVVGTTTAGNLTVTAGTVTFNTTASSIGNLTVNSTLASALVAQDIGVTVTGNTSLTAAGNATLATAGNDFAAVTIATGGDTAISDINNLTISGVSGGLVTPIAGAGTTAVAGPWALVLGNLTANSLAATASNGGGGVSGSITQAAGSMLHVETLAGFTTINGTITVANAGNSAGRVQLSTTGNGTITYAEDATVKLGTITNTGGNVTITARTGSIIEDPTGTNDFSDNGTLSLNAVNGAVTIGGTTLTTGTTVGTTATFAVNAPGGAVALKSTGANVTLSTINANSLLVNATGTGNLTQSNPLSIYGTANFTAAGNVILTNNSNNFGPILINETTASKNISINESGTMNLRTVTMLSGATGNFTATSANADIISSGFGGVKPGGNSTGSGTGVVTLSAPLGNITVGDATTDFWTSGGVVFNGNIVSLTVLGNSVLTLGAATTSSVANTLTVTSAIGSIANAGNIVVSGNASFTTGNGNISLNQSGDQFGGIKFSGNQVNIIQANNMNILTGSSAIGASSLASTGNITVVNGGSGGVASFGNTVSLIASGTIILPKMISVGGTLTVNAAGAKDLSALSLAGDLSSKTPVNLGTGAYSAPQP